MYIYPISYIRYGDIPIRIPPPHPTPCEVRPQRGRRGEGHGVGGNPLWGVSLHSPNSYIFELTL